MAHVACRLLLTCAWIVSASDAADCRWLRLTCARILSRTGSATVAYSAIYWSLRLEALVDAESERLAGEGVEAAPPCQAPLPSGNLAEGAFVIDRIRGVSDLPALSAVIPVLQDK